MSNIKIAEKFYTAFSSGNAEEMVKCYHPNIVFQDPAFGELKGIRAKSMWKMLLSSNSKAPKISFKIIQSNKQLNRVEWTAEYEFGKKKRNVVNHVEAKLKFEDGQIIEHIDSFDLWKWSQQALGLSGFFLGWTPFMKNKVQAMANSRLDKFMASKQ